MRISAKADYAVRAVAELAAADGDKPVKAERVATAQGIPLNFLENILGELRHAGIVRTHRGAEGGFRLARPADEVTVADVIRAVEGPLASVRGGPPEEAHYDGAAESLPTRVDRGARQPAPRDGAGDDRRHRRAASFPRRSRSSPRTPAPGAPSRAAAISRPTGSRRARADQTARRRSGGRT